MLKNFCSGFSESEKLVLVGFLLDGQVDARPLPLRCRTNRPHHRTRPAPQGLSGQRKPAYVGRCVQLDKQRLHCCVRFGPVSLHSHVQLVSDPAYSHNHRTVPHTHETWHQTHTTPWNAAAACLRLCPQWPSSSFAGLHAQQRHQRMHPSEQGPTALHRREHVRWVCWPRPETYHCLLLLPRELLGHGSPVAVTQEAEATHRNANKEDRP